MLLLLHSFAAALAIGSGSSTAASISTLHRTTASPTEAAVAAAASQPLTREELSSKILGFYPFPAGPEAHGWLAWFFKDTHQAIAVRTSLGSSRLFVDFMTAGGQSHPVWWDERTKYEVLLGGSITGEVRIRDSGEPPAPGSKLARLRDFAAEYDSRHLLSLYTSNCRIFCARMQREVERLNAEDREDAGTTVGRRAAFVADARLALAIFASGLLPALYPLGTLAVCWEGLRDL